MVNKYTVKSNISLVSAMEKIDSTSMGIVFAVDENGSLQGSLTDGDIRRHIIKTGSIDAVVSELMNRDCKYVCDGEEKKAVDILKQYRIHALPVIDSNRHVLNIVTDNSELIEEEKNDNTLIDTPVIIMAGGKGTRLYPYTKILPKPLIPIGDVPILERIIERFIGYGVSDIYLTLNYKKEMIRAYFADHFLSCNLHFVEENEPLGTAGSIRLIDRDALQGEVIVTNCDILIDAEYDKILEFHRAQNNDMTIVSSLKNTSIPYGVMHVEENGIVSRIEEKPTISNLINTGMYVVDAGVFSQIPEGKVYHMTDLTTDLISAEKRVGIYPISESSFLDMGEFEEMKKMEERIQSGV